MCGLFKRTPINLGINFVPQQEAWIIERMGRFHKILQPVLLNSLCRICLHVIKFNQIRD